MSAVQQLKHEGLPDGLARCWPDIAHDSAWLKELRTRAVDRVAKLHFPTARDEEWRFTDLGALRELNFEPAAAQKLHAPFADFERLIFPEAAATRLVFVNGHYAPEFSDTHEVPQGVTLTHLSGQGAVQDVLAARHLAQHADMHNEVFTALNTRLFSDVALLFIAPDVVCEQPLHLLFISTAQQTPLLSSPRCLIIGGRDSACTLVEEYVSLGEGVTFTNAVSEIVVEEGARMQHVRVQDEGHAAFHIASSTVTLARDARYQAINVTLGARLSRHTLGVVHHGPGTECAVDGLALISGRQLADTHSVIDHAAPHGKSTQLNKCIVDESAHAVFNGKIVVRRDAQLNDARQQSRNLLLSARARVNAKPELLIQADDVKCAHGATVGQLDEEQIFYLKCRGLSDAAARNLLTYAFAAEVVEKIPLVSLKTRLRAVILDRVVHAHASAEAA
ncbi:MAG: Fe-S cluster assembly protein SufD [Gammaproteobacteria bacterium]|nr:Fe-S cluster assembly protein SufD [Gammaproteobacteria bacterium]